MFQSNIRIHQRGSILVTTIILCVIAATSTLWMVQTLRDHQEVNTRGRDIERAYFAAKGGVAQVLHWGYYPEDYDSVTGLFSRDKTTSAGLFTNLTTALADGVCELDAGKFGSFESEQNVKIASVKYIDLLKPTTAELTNINNKILCKVRSVGSTPSGVKRQVTAYLVPNPLDVAEIVIPAALISLGSASMNGSGRVHWGEAWSKSDFNILNKSMYDYVVPSNPNYDPYAIYRTEQHFTFANNWDNTLGPNGADIYDEQNRRFPGQAPATGSYALPLEQLIPSGTLAWPDFLTHYQLFKEMAMAHGRYYTTDAYNYIYEGSQQDAAHRVVFDTEFGNAHRVTSPYDLVFIDTIDGQPPNADGTNLASITNSGSGLGMKGVYFICANYSQTGSGNPAPLACEKPDETTSNIDKTYLDGVLYSAGWINFGGNPTIYGSVIAQNGFTGSGTPEIYYNHKLADGLEMPKGNLGSPFRIVLQKNSAPDPDITISE